MTDLEMPADEPEPDDTAPRSNVTQLFPDDAQHLRMLEALLFAASEPMTEQGLAGRLPAGADVAALLDELATRYQKRGVNLVNVGGRWSFRTAADLAYLMRREAVEIRKLSRAAVETLAIVAYHQPVTRAEIEQIRGVTVSKGTVDVLLEIGWIKPRGRRKVPGRPLTFGTTPAFLEHFGLESLTELPGLDELKSAGFLDLNTFADVSVPLTRDLSEDEHDEDEEPLDGEEDMLSALEAEPQDEDEPDEGLPPT